MKKKMIFVFIILFLVIVSSLIIVLVYDKNSNVLKVVSKGVDKEVTIEVVQKEVNCNSLSIEEIEFRNEISEYNTSQKIMNLINNEFKIIERDDTLLPAIEVYEAKEGTEYDLFRLIFNILLKNNIQGALLVYEAGDNFELVLNFRDVEKPRYYYFEDGILKMAPHGWGFGDLLDAEEKRENIKIDRFGVFLEGDLFSEQKMDISEIETWELREKW